MSFSNPAALLWAALAVPIIIFYILKIRMRTVPVSTVMFWEQVFDEKTPRSFWQQLRHLLSLLLQLLFLALIVFSLADPFWESDIREQRRVIVVIDNSASMQALDDDVVRLEAAREQIQQMIRSLKPKDEMAIIVAGNQANVACGLTSHQRTLQNRLADIRPTDGPTKVYEAVEIGRRLLADHENGEVVVVTDGCFDDAKSIASGEDIVWSQVGSSLPNIGLTRFQVRRSLLDPIGYQVLVEISNCSDAAAECSLDLIFNEQLLDVLPVKLLPGEVWVKVFEKTSTTGGLLSAKLNTEDGFKADDLASAILPERLRIPVTLVSSGNWFLQRVLEANDVVELTLADTVPQDLPAGSVLVLHQIVPQKIPSGKVFVVQPKSATDLWTTNGKVEDPMVARQDKNSDLLQHVRLDNVIMPEALRLQPSVKANVLVESISGDPLYLQISRPDGDVVVLSVDLDQGDLPLRTAFPIMLTNALSWFSDGKGELIESLPTGKVVEISLPPELQQAAGGNNDQLMLMSPTGIRKPINVAESVAKVGPLSEAGIWSLGSPLTAEQEQQVDNGETITGDRTFMSLACNLNSPAESNLRPSKDIDPKRKILEAGFGGRPLWFYLVVAAFVLMMAEWFLFQRRWIS